MTNKKDTAMPITIDTPNVKIGMRVKSNITGNIGTIDGYDKDWKERKGKNFNEKYDKQGWLTIKWDNGNISSHCLFDPDYGKKDGRGAPYSNIDIISQL